MVIIIEEKIVICNLRICKEKILGICIIIGETAGQRN